MGDYYFRRGGNISVACQWAILPSFLRPPLEEERREGSSHQVGPSSSSSSFQQYKLEEGWPVLTASMEKSQPSFLAFALFSNVFREVAGWSVRAPHSPFPIQPRATNQMQKSKRGKAGMKGGGFLRRRELLFFRGKCGRGRRAKDGPF